MLRKSLLTSLLPLGLGGSYIISDEQRRKDTFKSLAASARIARLIGTVVVSATDYTITRLDSQHNHGQNSKIEEEIATKKAQLEEFAGEQERNTITQLTTKDPAVREEMNTRIKQTRQKIDITTNNIAKLAVQNPAGKWEMCHKRNAIRLRDMCAKNKGVYIKLGQHLAMLDYVLPHEYTEVLSTLLSQTPTSTWADVQAVIREDLGGKEASVLFDSIESTPIASASLAQVHVAYKDGKKLAVKVQHRGLHEESSYDMKAITAVVDVLGRVFEDFQYAWLTREMNLNLPQELDFRVEQRNLLRATENMRDMIKRGDLVIPATHDALSSTRVLTMDFEEGVYISEVAKMRDMGLQPADVSHVVSTVFCEQMYRHGFVHCDPHPANLLVRPHPRRAGKPTVVLLDHGLYKELDNWFRLEYCRLWSALVRGDKLEIRRTCDNMHVGPAYTLLAAMLTMRSWDDITNKDRDRLQSKDLTADSEMLKVYAAKYYTDIVKLLGRVDSDILLLLKTNDCLRHLDKKLGCPVNTTKIVAKITGDVLIVEDLWPSDTRRDAQKRQEQQEAMQGRQAQDYKYQEEFKRKNYSELYSTGGDGGVEGLAAAEATDAIYRQGELQSERPASGVMFWLHPKTHKALWNYGQMQTRLAGLYVLELWVWATGK